MTASRDLILVDDEADLREPTAVFLRGHGYAVREADGGAALDRLYAAARPALVVLDVTMPVEDGLSIARRLRIADPHVGIVMLTARADVLDRVLALEMGADDYVVKPFEPRELLARINAVFRRIGTMATSPPSPPPPAPAEPSPRLTELWVDTPRGSVGVPVAAIEWIEAAGDYALLHTADRNHMLRVTMSDLEAGLDPADLMRVHRSHFVRPAAVTRVSRVGRRAHALLASGAAVKIGEPYLKALLAAIA